MTLPTFDLDVIDAFIAAPGMPRTLDALGVKAGDHALIAADTLHDFRARTNPRRIDKAQGVLPVLQMTSAGASDNP